MFERFQPETALIFATCLLGVLLVLSVVPLTPHELAGIAVLAMWVSYLAPRLFRPRRRQATKRQPKQKHSEFEELVRCEAGGFLVKLIKLRGRPMVRSNIRVRISDGRNQTIPVSKLECLEEALYVAHDLLDELVPHRGKAARRRSSASDHVHVHVADERLLDAAGQKKTSEGSPTANGHDSTEA